MIIYTDSIDYAQIIGGERPGWVKVRIQSVSSNIRKLMERLYKKDTIYVCESKSSHHWKYLFLTESTPESQYDILIQCNQSESELPDGILCLAGAGLQFHGFKQRPWVSVPGNIHLSVFFSPHQAIDHFGSGFLTLAAVSVVQTIDSIQELTGKASIRWVNDIIIQNAKVCGVLAYTQTMGSTVTGAVLGIGLNVETTPEVPYDIFTPKVGSLTGYVKNQSRCTQHMVFKRLIYFLNQNYRLLLTGQYQQLLAFYRERSMVIGKEVQIYSDPTEGDSEMIIQGKVTGINDDLELLIDGADRPVTKGRLKLAY